MCQLGENQWVALPFVRSYLLIQRLAVDYDSSCLSVCGNLEPTQSNTHSAQ